MPSQSDEAVIEDMEGRLSVRIRREGIYERALQEIAKTPHTGSPYTAWETARKALQEASELASSHLNCVLVRFAPEILEKLATEGSEPVVILGVEQQDDGTYDMTLQIAPGRDELLEALAYLVADFEAYAGQEAFDSGYFRQARDLVKDRLDG